MLINFRYLDRVIRGEAIEATALRQGEIEQPVGGLALLGAVMGALYGVCMGCFALFQGGKSPMLQMIAALLKVPALIFLTLAVTFPSLYVFNALVGSRLSMQSVLRLLVISLTVMFTVLASLGPIVAFFSACTTSYHFMLLLNVAIFAASGVLGLRYMVVTMNRLSQAQKEYREISLQSSVALSQTVPSISMEHNAVTPQNPSVAQGLGFEFPLPGSVIRSPQSYNTPLARLNDQGERTVFKIWLVVFGLVGSQMAWVLRPFIGSPDRVFTWFRPRESNFFEAVFSALEHLLK